jgi:hypothetical protein
MVEATVTYIKLKPMKGWKEQNANVQKEAINVLQTMVSVCPDVSRKSFAVFVPLLCEKIGDTKMATQVKVLLLSVAAFVTPRFVASQIVKQGMATKAVANIKATCEVLSVMID